MSSSGHYSGGESPLSILSHTPSIPDSPFYDQFREASDAIKVATPVASSPDAPASSPVESETIRIATPPATSPVARSPPRIILKVTPPRHFGRQSKPTARTASSNSEDDAFFPGLDVTTKGEVKDSFRLILPAKPVKVSIKGSTTVKDSEKPPPKKRGRPPKRKPEEVNEEPVGKKVKKENDSTNIKDSSVPVSTTTTTNASKNLEDSAKLAPKPRGRPPKRKAFDENEAAPAAKKVQVAKPSDTPSDPKPTPAPARKALPKRKASDETEAAPAAKKVKLQKGSSVSSNLKPTPTSVPAGKDIKSKAANKSSSLKPAKKVQINSIATVISNSPGEELLGKPFVEEESAPEVIAAPPPNPPNGATRCSNRAKKLSAKALEALKTEGKEPPPQQNAELHWAPQGDGDWGAPTVVAGLAPKPVIQVEPVIIDDTRTQNKKRGYTGKAKPTMKSRVHSVAHWKRLYSSRPKEEKWDDEIEEEQFDEVELPEEVWRKQFGVDVLPEPTGYGGCYFDDDDDEENVRGNPETGVDNRSRDLNQSFERGGEDIVELIQVKGTGKEHAESAGVNSRSSDLNQQSFERGGDDTVELLQFGVDNHSAHLNQQSFERGGKDTVELLQTGVENRSGGLNQSSALQSAQPTRTESTTNNIRSSDLKKSSFQEPVRRPDAHNAAGTKRPSDSKNLYIQDDFSARNNRRAGYETPTDEEEAADMAKYYENEMSVTHHPDRLRYLAAVVRGPNEGQYGSNKSKRYAHGPIIADIEAAEKAEQAEKKRRGKRKVTAEMIEARKDYGWDSTDRHHRQAPPSSIRGLLPAYEWKALDDHHTQAPESCVRGSFPEPDWKTDKYRKELVGGVDNYSAPFKPLWAVREGDFTKVQKNSAIVEDAFLNTDFI